MEEKAMREFVLKSERDSKMKCVKLPSEVNQIIE